MSHTDAAILSFRDFSQLLAQSTNLDLSLMQEPAITSSEARVLSKLEVDEGNTASEIKRVLDLDAGYLSRIIFSLEQQGLILRNNTAEDRRRYILLLTNKGAEVKSLLLARERLAIEEFLNKFPNEVRDQLLTAGSRAQRFLKNDRSPTILRNIQVGDLGWVISRHGEIYQQEFGAGAKIEANVAKIAGDFLANNDPARERGWIAEADGIRVASVFVMRETDEAARIRFLVVDSASREAGLAQTMLTTLIDFARQAGYRRIVLWTHTVLAASRRLYERNGFEFVSSSTHTEFGIPLTSEDWVLELNT